MIRGKIHALLVGLLATLAPGVSADERPLVIVLRTSQKAPFVRALEGAQAELQERTRIEVVTVDMDDPEQGGEIQGRSPDVLLTLGSRATLWAMDQTEKIPIVFAMALHPVSSQLVTSMQRPGGRVTGAALDIPLSLHFKALRDVVGAQRVAVLYDPAETELLIREARRAARRFGIELQPITVAGPKALERSLDQVDDSFDALWSVADRTVMSRGAAERVLLHTLRQGVPFIGLSEQFVRAGALMALVTSYEANGRQAAGLVERVLAGRAPSSLPVVLPEGIEIVFNPRTAARLNFEPTPEARASMRAVD